MQSAAPIAEVKCWPGFGAGGLLGGFVRMIIAKPKGSQIHTGQAENWGSATRLTFGSARRMNRQSVAKQR